MSFIDENTQIEYHKLGDTVTSNTRKPLLIIELPVSHPDKEIVISDEIKKDYHVLTISGKEPKIKYIIIGETLAK